MGFFSDIGRVIDPSGNNFLGLGKGPGRAVAGVFTGGTTELFKSNPFGAKEKTIFAKTLGGSATGAAAGVATGFVTGGPYGAILGGVIGGVAGGVAGATGKTKNTNVKGVAINTGLGVAGGLAGGGIAHLSVGAASTASVTLPKVATPAFSFGSLKGLAGTLGIAGLAQKFLTPAQLAKLDLPAAAQSAVGGLIPQNLTPGTNVSSFILPPVSGNTGAAPQVIDAQLVHDSPNYLWLILLVAAGLAYLYFKHKKRRG